MAAAGAIKSGRAGRALSLDAGKSPPPANVPNRIIRATPSAPTWIVRVQSSYRHSVKAWLFGFVTGVVLVCWICYTLIMSGALR
jgi:hypothetical protein